MRNKKPTLLYGPHGSGKTYRARQEANKAFSLMITAKQLLSKRTITIDTRVTLIIIDGACIDDIFKIAQLANHQLLEVRPQRQKAYYMAMPAFLVTTNEDFNCGQYEKLKALYKMGKCKHQPSVDDDLPF